MKKLFSAAIVLLLATAAYSREVIDIRKWDFRLDAEKTWRSVTIPHDFQMELPWEEEAGGARGFKRMETGWYRTTFVAGKDWEGECVLLDFEGVGMQADIWVNGQQAGEIDYGYIGGCFDIRALLKYGSENEILVKTFTGEAEGSRWYTGGGLFRPVHLIVKSPISIAEKGIYITTPMISEQRAEVNLQITMDGYRASVVPVDATVEIFDPDGKLVAETSHAAPMRNNLMHVEFNIYPIFVENPKLWSCEEPWLYTAKVTLRNGTRELDCVSEHFGFRTIEFGQPYGFKLNGKKVFLKGIANHHDLGALGAAVYDGALERMIIRLKEFGFNHIRTSHNPYSKSLLDLADKYGILVVDELYDKWMTQPGQWWIGRYPFTASWFNHEREWIKRDRNHPCVIAWSLGNETQNEERRTGFPETSDWGVTTWRVMKTFGQRYDDTRPYTAAMHPTRRGGIYKNDDRFDVEVYAPELACATDFASFNYRHMNYRQYLEHDPYLNIYQSEATTSELAVPFFNMDYDQMIGLAYWGAIEYWGESDGWPKKGWNYSFFNSALEPYPQAYLIKSAFDDTPLVHIAVVDGTKSQIEWNDVLSGKTPMSESWNREKGSLQQIYTFTNADEVELFVNGKSLGRQSNDRSSIERRNVIFWKDVPYGNGGSVVAVARTAGREVARHRIETTGKAVALKAVRENLDGELEYVRVYAVDSKGRNVRDSQAEVLFSLEGGAQIVAVDNQDHYTDELFDVNPKAMHNGFVMAIVRKGSGPSTLKASAKGLKSAAVVISE
ncbi:MAG: DUF4982 domain-containing protein [Bacteroidales bacterium]|nr:DUF4982 domain-containing protein [Bacteroidales bacterium]